MVSKILIAIVLVVAMFALISETQAGNYNRYGGGRSFGGRSFGGSGFASGYALGAIGAARTLNTYAALSAYSGLGLGLGIGGIYGLPAGVLYG